MDSCEESLLSTNIWKHTRTDCTMQGHPHVIRLCLCLQATSPVHTVGLFWRTEAPPPRSLSQSQEEPRDLKPATPCFLPPRRSEGQSELKRKIPQKSVGICELLSLGSPFVTCKLVNFRHSWIQEFRHYLRMDPTHGGREKPRPRLAQPLGLGVARSAMDRATRSPLCAVSPSPA